jgi:hypothetical protein
LPDLLTIAQVETRVLQPALTALMFDPSYFSYVIVPKTKIIEILQRKNGGELS